MSENKKNRELMNVERTDSIDAAAYNKESKTLILQLTDGMDWSYEGYHLPLLQEKINNYLWYIESKQYLETYPEAERVNFKIAFYFKESENCSLLLSNLEQVILRNFENVTLFIEQGSAE